MNKPTSCLIVADFNAGNLAGYLANDARLPSVDVHLAPMADVTGSLLQQDSEVLGRCHDAVVVWTRPHLVSTSFNALLNGDDISVSHVLIEVDAFARSVIALHGTVAAVLVPTWIMPSDHRSFGLLAMRDRVGAANVLMRMNLRLAEQVASCDDIYLLEAQRWIQRAGRAAYSPRLWHLAKIPFGHPVFREAVADIKAAIRAVAGDRRKLVVVDLDNTLWGGIVGDIGWENLILGGHDPAGEAYVAFQLALKALARRGVLLGVVSKNEQAVVLEAWERHPEMILRAADFAGWRINWEDKAANIASLVSELNLGLESVVFIDDSPAERGRVREALPEVLVPDWPTSPLLFASTLAELDCFDTVAITAEDRQRHHSYAAEQARQGEQRAIGSFDDWLCSLQLKVRVTALDDANAQRVAQLLNKTNQMNLSTRRLSVSQLRGWLAEPDHRLWAFRVMDKFGDAGLVGVISIAFESDDARVIDFVLSCRVFGRNVEDAMFHHAIEQARQLGMRTLTATYAPTAKNAPCLRFLERSGLTGGPEHVFQWDLVRYYAPPRHVEFDVLAEA